MIITGKANGFCVKPAAVPAKPELTEFRSVGNSNNTGDCVKCMVQ